MNIKKYALSFYVLLVITIISCKKEGAVPLIKTQAISSIQGNSAISGGEITSEGGSEITSKGVCWNTTSHPTIADTKTEEGSGKNTFTSNIGGLLPATTYYVRAYAKNNSGVAYGNELSFQTLDGVVDIDGNFYHKIKINNQVWMVENLKVTHYRNGDPIPNVPNYLDWPGLTSGACCNYNNVPDNGNIYGRLYNYYVIDDYRKIAPSGWHVPTAAEFNSLRSYLGGLDLGGGPLKEAGTSHWSAPNTGATNNSGFTALPGGFIIVNYLGAGLGGFGTFGAWWLSDSYSGNGEFMGVNSTSSVFQIYSAAKPSGLSIRLIQD